MALSITPGYDFTVNEVPTRAKLQLMLTGMVIAGIPKESLDSSLFGISYGWLTGSTMATLANEGDVLFDISGQFWVKTKNGPVNVYNTGAGGWETVRYRTADPRDTAFNNPLSPNNFYGALESLVASNLDEDEVWFRIYTTQSQNLYCLPQVTTHSGAHNRVRPFGTGRGTILQSTGSYPRDSLTGNRNFCYTIEKAAGSVNEWNVNEFPCFNDNAAGLGTKMGYGGPEETNDIRSFVFMVGADFMVI